MGGSGALGPAPLEGQPRRTGSREKHPPVEFVSVLPVDREGSRDLALGCRDGCCPPPKPVVSGRVG
jgi:hypothetical protein